MTTNVPKNIRTIYEGRPNHYVFKVKFKNGKTNDVYLYPREFVNLANKYINTKSAPYRISRNSINWNQLNELKRTQAKKLLNERNFVVMHKLWSGWVNKNFKYEGRTLKLVPAIEKFIQKTKKEQQTPRVAYINGKYVKVPTMRNRAAYLVKQLRERQQRLAKIKAALRHAFNYERAKKRHAGFHKMRYESQNNFAY
jgi:hypothetical protein